MSQSVLPIDRFMATLCLWREARGQSFEEKVGIFHVLLNRMNDAQKRWPRDLTRVVLQPWQFSSFNLGEVNSTKFPINDSGPDWVAWLECEKVTGMAGATMPDPTSGANHYESLRPGVDTFPKWARENEDKITYRLGKFRFYKL